MGETAYQIKRLYIKMMLFINLGSVMETVDRIPEESVLLYLCHPIFLYNSQCPSWQSWKPLRFRLFRYHLYGFSTSVCDKGRGKGC